MALIFHSDEDDPEAWRDLMRAAAPEIDFRVYPDEEGDPSEIDFALVNPSGCGVLHRYPNLKAVLSLFAGVEAFMARDDLPDAPIIRLVSSDLTAGMTEYVVMHVLRYYRELDDYARQSREHVWRPRPLNEDYRRVGVLGLGVLGRDAAEKLSLLGFDVAGWSRSQKSVPGVECYAGAEGLAAFLARSHIVVSLLPLTPETENLVDADFLSRMPAGSYFINAARGGQVVDADLIAALDSGRLAGATLDVFREEPLPPGHPFWGDDRILVTPHVASVSRPCPESAQWYVDNIRRILAGEPPLGGVVDRNAGY